MKEIIERSLFTFKLDALESHITKNVDINASEANLINKCHTAESRTAAYDLLITLCRE